MNNTELAQVTEESRLRDHMNIRLSDSLFSKDLAPHYMQLAAKLASSDLVPKSFRGKPQDLFICWAMGYQIGLTPEQSMQCIAVINGKPAMWGDDMLALCMAHKDFVDIIEEPIRDSAGQIIGYRCTVKRLGKADKVNEFDLNMAKKAGLLAKGGVWTQYPERMLKLRARGFCLRDAFPDALKGIKPREEVEDYLEAEYKVAEHSGSRTELLKNDFMSKMGDNNASDLNGLCAPNANIPIEQEATDNREPIDLDQTPNETTALYFKIKQLIEEKGVTEERVAKALTYYEAESIESMDITCAHDFLAQLIKI